MTARDRTILRNVALGAILGLVLITGDTLLRQASQYRQAETARRKGRFIPALTAFGSAIRMYLPGSPLTERSARAIWVLADERQAAGDREGAILACRELRSAFHAVRSLTAPGREWIDRCDRRLAALAGQRDDTPQTGPQTDGKGSPEKRP